MTEATAFTNGGGPTVVLTHGGFVYGSGWQGIHGVSESEGGK
jgi:hypothetical protein